MARKKEASIRMNPICGICEGYMLAGVPPLEPAWFCPTHPDEQPVEVVSCEHRGGRGWKRA